MLKWFKARADRAREIEEQEREERRARLKATLALQKENMLARPCAVNGMRNCDEACVHFREGHVMEIPDFHGGMMYNMSSPGCKLWRQA